VRILDLFCGAGGAAKGYQDAGWEVVGVDIVPQKNYLYEFWQRDALYLLENRREEIADQFDAIHSSPPCQHYANVTSWRGDQDEHPALIAPLRELLEATGLPYAIENVETKELRPDFILCGSNFGLPLRRHRYFETNWSGPVQMSLCQHRATDYSFDHGGKQPESIYRDAMGVPWMTVRESRQAIPPAYTEYIGTQLLDYLREEMAA
jgi:hypothetical protein